MQQRSVLTGEPTSMDRDRFEIFKSTQQGQLESRFVLLSALRKPEVAKTRTVLEEQRRGGIPWLDYKGCYRSAFRRKAEIMQVSITRPDPHEATVLVNAVVDSYRATL